MKSNQGTMNLSPQLPFEGSPDLVVTDEQLAAVYDQAVDSAKQAVETTAPETLQPTAPQAAENTETLGSAAVWGRKLLEERLVAAANPVTEQPKADLSTANAEAIQAAHNAKTSAAKVRATHKSTGIPSANPYVKAASIGIIHRGIGGGSARRSKGGR